MDLARDRGALPGPPAGLLPGRRADRRRGVVGRRRGRDAGALRRPADRAPRRGPRRRRLPAADEFPRRPRTEPPPRSTWTARTSRRWSAGSRTPSRPSRRGTTSTAPSSSWTRPPGGSPSRRPTATGSRTPPARRGLGRRRQGAVIVPSRALDALAKAGARSGCRSRRANRGGVGRQRAGLAADRRRVPRVAARGAPARPGAGRGRPRRARRGGRAGRLGGPTTRRARSGSASTAPAPTWRRAARTAGHEARATLDVSSPRRSRAASTAATWRRLRGGRRAGALSLVGGTVLRLDPEDRPDDRFVVIGLRMTAIEQERPMPDEVRIVGDAIEVDGVVVAIGSPRRPGPAGARRWRT
jgi:hypothetical protein